MSIQIKLAQSPWELDQVLQLRYKVFAEEENYYPQKDDPRIFDRYDILPTNANFIALEGDEPIGALRLTQLSEVGIPSEGYFDYSKHLPYYDNRIVSGSMLCIRKKHRGNHRILLGMIWMGLYWGFRKKATHILAPINPTVKRVFMRMGFETLAEEIHDEKTGLVTLPMALDFSNSKDAFLQFVQKQEMLPYLENFKREIYRSGEAIICIGDIGDSAYVIVDGKVEVSLPQETGKKVIAKLGSGEMFGEIALLTEAPRTANVTALGPVDLMVLDRNDFQAGVLSDPAHSLQLIHLLSQRLKDTLATLASR